VPPTFLPVFLLKHHGKSPAKPPLHDRVEGGVFAFHGAGFSSPCRRSSRLPQRPREGRSAPNEPRVEAIVRAPRSTAAIDATPSVGHATALLALFAIRSPPGHAVGRLRKSRNVRKNKPVRSAAAAFFKGHSAGCDRRRHEPASLGRRLTSSNVDARTVVDGARSVVGCGRFVPPNDRFVPFG